MLEKEFDHIVKQKLEAITDTPPAYMWDRIASGMPAAAVSSGLSTTVKLSMVAAMVVLISGLSFLIMQEGEAVKRDVIKNVQFNNSEYSIKRTQQVSNLKEPVSPTPENSNLQNQTGKISSKIEKSKKLDQQLVQKTTKRVNDEVSDNEFDALVKLHNPSEIRKAEQPVSLDKDLVKTNTEVNHQAVSYPLAIDPKTTEAKAAVVKENNAISTTEEVAVGSEGNKETKASEQNVASSQVEETNNEVSTTAVAKTPKHDETEVLRDDPKNRQLNKYGIGFHYGPEFMDIDGAKLTDHGFDFSFNYQNLNFILQTGLGLRFSQDQIAYNMKYERWDYLETQIRFDSAVFVLDQYGNPVLQPVDPYYVDVYDSITHSYYATATQQTTMLQIPILVGYQQDFKRFAYFIKGGIRYSLVIYTHTKDLLEIDNQSRLVNMNYPQQIRTKSNIDYELALGGVYKLNKSFQVQAEIFGRYYHYSIYEKNPPSEVNPWSLSGRIGLVYIFR